MNTSTSIDCGELDRRAFAESDPKKKLVLLHEVQKAICDWEAGAYLKANERESERKPQQAAS